MKLAILLKVVLVAHMGFLSLEVFAIHVNWFLAVKIAMEIVLIIVTYVLMDISWV